MRAVVYEKYGSPDVLDLRGIDKPEVVEDGVLVRVIASSLNPRDWHLMRGLPYLIRAGAGIRRPKSAVLGVDFAGMVEEVGNRVTGFRPGDQVFGARSGSLAEYVCTGENGVLAPKPTILSFEEAAAAPLAGITALQALRDYGKLQGGHSVLINGAAGGVGTFAVQIAKAFGAEVAGVCHTRNVAMVRKIGADRVVDYTGEDFTRSGHRYDLILDAVGNRSLSDIRRALKPKGTLVIVGAGGGRWLGPLTAPVRAVVVSRFVSQRMVPMLTRLNQADLLVLTGLMDAGKVRPVIDRKYALSDVPEATRYLEAGHARGKVVIDISSPR